MSRYRRWQFQELRDEEGEGGEGGTGGEAGEEIPKEPISFGEEIIPEELKGRSPEEIKLLLSQMPRVVKAQKDEIDYLKSQSLSAHQPPANMSVEPAGPTKSFEELLDEDPRAAMKLFVEEEYGATIGDLQNRVGEGEFGRIKSMNPGFDEYEEDVRTLLNQSKTPATEANILGAYAMAKGQRELVKEQQMRRLADSTTPAAPAPDDKGKAPELSPLQDEVRGAMGLSAEDYVKYTADTPLDVKIRQ